MWEAPRHARSGGGSPPVLEERSPELEKLGGSAPGPTAQWVAVGAAACIHPSRVP